VEATIQEQVIARTMSFNAVVMPGFRNMSPQKRNRICGSEVPRWGFGLQNASIPDVTLVWLKVSTTLIFAANCGREDTHFTDCRLNPLFALKLQARRSFSLASLRDMPLHTRRSAFFNLERGFSQKGGYPLFCIVLRSRAW
jgi:hypothetical protein